MGETKTVIHLSTGCVGEELSCGIPDSVGSRMIRETVQFYRWKNDPSFHSRFMELTGPAHSE